MSLHCMIDIETLGTTPDAVVLSLGAVVFSMYDEELVDTHYVKLEVGDQVAAGRTRCQRTMEWWSQQPDAARDEVFGTDGKMPVRDALDELAEFLSPATGVSSIWGNGSNFDNVIVADLYRSFHREAPWQFWQDRCFRTVCALLDPDKRLKPRFAGTPHHALHDAINQTVYLQAIAKAHPTVVFRR